MKKFSQEWLDKYIDKGMQYAIRELNVKGYDTLYCCEGHYKERSNSYSGAYLLLCKPISKELFPRLPSFPWKDDNKTQSQCKNAIMIAGMGYKNRFADKTDERIFYWEGTQYKRVSRAEKDEEHNRFIKELNEWVDSLPVRQ